MNRRLFAALFAGMALALPAFPISEATAQTGAAIVRDSTGARRASLDKMEMQEFPAEAWSKLTGWTGDPITGGGSNGKPILVFAWASWHPASQRSLHVAKQMIDKYAGQGLIVVGVHHQQGWDKAAETAKSRGVDMLQAHDATGEFRKIIKMDSEPAWYVIDRAGRLRYASVATTSVDSAVGEVVGETLEHASDLPRVLSERAAKEAALAARTTDIRQNFDLTSLPPIPPGIIAPSEEAYEKAKWPKMDKALGKEIGLIDQQTDKQLTPSLAFEPEGFHPRPPVTAGRITVIYWWHPDIYMSYDGVMQQMDVLQRQYPRDLAVVGALLPPEKIDPQRQQNQQQDQEEAMEKLRRKYESFTKSRVYEHALAADISGSALASISANGSQKFPLPGAMLVSTDGVIRWVGWTNNSDFKYAIDSLLANDPGVLARRAADRKFIEQRGKR